MGIDGRAKPATGVDRALGRVYAAGRRAHPTLHLDAQAFGAEYEARFAERARRLGVALDALLERVAAADLYLAAACEAGHESAWEVLTTTYASRLVGLTVRRGVPPPEAAALVDEVLGGLAVAPPRGGARTRLGTYLGAGTLFGWLATIVVRRLADRTRRRQPLSLDADPEAAAAVRATAEEEPPQRAAHREAARDAAAALSSAWAALTPRERLAVTLKYRDGLTQRAAAGLLGVGEPRVSRLVRQALEKISAPLRSAVGTFEDADWPALRNAIQVRLETLAAELRPPVEGPVPQGVRHES